MFSLKRLASVTALVALLFTGAACGQQLAPKAPQKAPPAETKAQLQLVLERDYSRVNPPQATDSGNRVEVIEFFWYGCIHCYHLEVPLKAWLKRKPADVVFRYVPAIFDSASWSPMARAYYALDAMGIVEKHHDDIFTAIHRDGQKAMVTDPRVFADWLAGRGVDKQKFLDTYNSFAVNGRTQRSADMTRSYDVPGTPTLVVDGKYLTGPSMTTNADKSVNYERFFQVLDQLVAQARKERASPKK
jgi:thiol:disulfide interchange protein DsbA